MNALGDATVADYLNANFVSTYLKVGTFQIVNGQKQGGNVASYFCLHDGAVIHAIPGKVEAPKMMAEARWASETRKAARTFSFDLRTGKYDMQRYSDQIKKSHTERFYSPEFGGMWGGGNKQMMTIPASMPRGNQQAQAHWLLAKSPMARLDNVYPTVWEQVLKEKLSTLPVAQR